ncbi:NAD-P-binding protein [Lactarius psammicola]|nr:NAD-P-binding protein [Lactarius psammicola]
MAPWDKCEGNDEGLPVTQHDEYISCAAFIPRSTPEPLYAAQAYQGKVVLVTGASRGIGQEISLQYARAGAALAIVARSEESLGETKRAILDAVPSAEVLMLAADVRDAQSAARAVKAVLARFGKLDILISNAGAISPVEQTLHQKDPDSWWNTFEVNVRGVFNFFHAAATALEQSRGYYVAISSVGAQIRNPGTSDANMSKHAVNRLIEFIVLEYPKVRAFALAPGVVRTRLAIEAGAGVFPDKVALPAATSLYLTSGRADWLSGRYYSANWDIAEVERDWKDAILERKGLVNKLNIPKL